MSWEIVWDSKVLKQQLPIEKQEGCEKELKEEWPNLQLFGGLKGYLNLKI